MGQEGRKRVEQPVHASDENTLLSFRNRMLCMYHPPEGGLDGTAVMDAKEYVGMEWERDVTRMH